MEWITLRHSVTGAEHKFPASVRESAEKRGWVEADAEAEIGEQIGDSEPVVDDDDYSEDRE